MADENSKLARAVAVWMLVTATLIFIVDVRSVEKYPILTFPLVLAVTAPIWLGLAWGLMKKTRISLAQLLVALLTYGAFLAFLASPKNDFQPVEIAYWSLGCLLLWASGLFLGSRSAASIPPSRRAKKWFFFICGQFLPHAGLGALFAFIMLNFTSKFGGILKSLVVAIPLFAIFGVSLTTTFMGVYKQQIYGEAQDEGAGNAKRED